MNLFELHSLQSDLLQAMEARFVHFQEPRYRQPLMLPSRLDWQLMFPIRQRFAELVGYS